MIHISLLRTPGSSRHIPDILPEAENLFPEKAKLPTQDSSSEPSQLKPVGHMCLPCFLFFSGPWRLAQEVGHSGQGLGTRPGTKWLGVGTQTLRKPGGCPWDVLNPLHSLHTVREAEVHIRPAMAWHTQEEGGGTGPLNAEPSPSTFFSCLPLRDSQSEFLRPFASNAEKFLGAFHTLS